MTSPRAFSARIMAFNDWRDDRHDVALLVAVFLFACAVVIARRPDAVFHAQFFAEDGRIWFADAYNLG